MKNTTAIIENMIYEIRGYKVMLDSDLAKLYEIETKILNRAVKRNIDRFPKLFMFQLTENEWKNLRTKRELVPIWHQFDKTKHRPSLPYVFTEHGVLMLSSVLNSKKAININIDIMVAFINLRQYVLSQPCANEQIAELRKLLMLYIEKNDRRVDDIIIALNNLIKEPKSTRKIGFNPD
jgi:hypothetical protein